MGLSFPSASTSSSRTLAATERAVREFAGLITGSSLSARSRANVAVACGRSSSPNAAVPIGAPSMAATITV